MKAKIILERQTLDLTFQKSKMSVMPDNAKEKIVKEIAKNSLEKIIISLRKYREKDLIDARTYYQDSKGDWLPTRKGISISTEHYDDLKEGVLALEKELEDF